MTNREKFKDVFGLEIDEMSSISATAYGELKRKAKETKNEERR